LPTKSRPRTSAGILLFRRHGAALEVFLVHPGGPFWTNKDAGAWSIPKGEFEPDENPLAAAKREFAEEIGMALDTVAAPGAEPRALTPITQKNRKVVHAWAVEGDLDPASIKSDEFELEWPPKSGKRITIPEVDRGAWFALDEAVKKINPAQAALVKEFQNLKE
jgi:predicted NUDIX family NTP pyrophosphohydrolase